MARKRKEPMKKNCLWCGREIIQPRWKSGKLDGNFKARKFCSSRCAGYRVTIKANTGRKRAQREFKVDTCETCGATDHLQRHHKDEDPTNNAPENVVVLCQKCHTAEHMKAGTWGKGKTLKPVLCAICGKEFQPRKSRSRLCGDPQCRKEMGRRSAQKRWQQLPSHA